jgi:hypothetical protein
MANLRLPPRSAALDPDAARFYRTHAERLIDNNTLNESTLDIYLILCRLHGHLAKLDPHEDSKKAIFYFATLKKIQEYSKPFGLFNDQTKVKPQRKTTAEVMRQREKEKADALENEKAQD